MTAVIDHLRGASPRYVWNSWFLSDMLDIAASSCYNGQLKHILACDPSDQVEFYPCFHIGWRHRGHEHSIVC